MWREEQYIGSWVLLKRKLFSYGKIIGLEVTILQIIFSSTSSQVPSLDSGKKNGSIVLLIVLEPKFLKPY